jgi:thiamine-phosphate pyrophosphorylase
MRMSARQTEWPRQWLMTDERMGERLWTAIDGLPAGAGIVVRHYSLAPDARADLARRAAEIGRRHRLTVAIARDVDLARALGADLVHNPGEPPGDLPFSRSVHSLAEAEAARAAGAALVFVSPVHPTNSHPGQKPLGRELALKIARSAGAPAIALGGMDAEKFAPLQDCGFYGWAGIGAWLRT